MTIKEFSHKHGLVFFYTTVILAIVLILIIIAGLCSRGNYRFDGRRDMMKGGYYNDDFNKRGQMMNRQQRPIDNVINIPVQELPIEQSVQ